MRTGDAGWAVVLWLLMSLASARATRFIVRDTVVDAPREWLLGFLEARDHPKIAELLTCPWCIGFWVSCAVVGLTDWQTSVPLVGLQVPAVSCVSAQLVGRESE